MFQKKTYLSNTVVAIRKRSHLLNCSRDISALDNFSGYYSTSIYSFAQLQMKNKYITYVGDKKNGLLVFSNRGFDLLENTYENHIDGMGQTTSTNSNFF